MRDLNLHHLYYFWVVAKEGGVTNACRKLHLAQPTVSAQIIELEEKLGQPLFKRSGKRMALTEAGELALDYANQIFSFSRELLDILRDAPYRRSVVRMQLGVVDQVSKQVVHALLKKVYAFKPEAQVIVHEGTLSHMLEELKVHDLDLLLSNIDVPAEEIGDYLKVAAGTLPIHFVAAPAVARRLKAFPADLSNAPLLLPTRASPVWQGVEHFLNRHGIEPRIVAEVQGVELLRLMALDGMGVAPLNPIATHADMAAGKLVRLNRVSTGILKTIWLIAKKRHRFNPIAEHRLENFKITRPR
jgi:LysR family transcriptional regulator, transcriptional activator of nhaA